MMAAARKSMSATKRIGLGVVAVALVAGAAGCSGVGSGAEGPGLGAVNGAAGEKKKGAEAAPKRVFQAIGDGSTAFTGVQPKQPAVDRLTNGRKPRSSWCSRGTERARTANGSSRTSARWAGSTTPR